MQQWKCRSKTMGTFELTGTNAQSWTLLASTKPSVGIRRSDNHILPPHTINARTNAQPTASFQRNLSLRQDRLRLNQIHSITQPQLFITLTKSQKHHQPWVCLFFVSERKSTKHQWESIIVIQVQTVANCCKSFVDKQCPFFGALTGHLSLTQKENTWVVGDEKERLPLNHVGIELHQSFGVINADGVDECCEIGGRASYRNFWISRL